MTQVSVIIPTRNRAQLLRQTLRSVLDQRWPNVEPIVVDEASGAGTAAVLEDFSDRIQVIHHDSPKGPSAARNAGIDASSGAYVLFLDDDDLLHPSHIEELVQASEDLPPDQLAASGWRRFHLSGEGIDLGPVVRPPEHWGSPEAINAMFGHDPGCLVWGPSVLWPRALVNKIRWDEELFTNGDIDFYARVLEDGYTFRGTDAGMAYYRSHDGISVSGKSASDTQSERSIVSGAKCRLKHSKRLREQPERDVFAPAMREALMRILIRVETHGGLAEWGKRLRNEYEKWGGTYYLPQPPQHWIKRGVLKAALRVKGPSAVGTILRAYRRIASHAEGEHGTVAPQSSAYGYDRLMQVLQSAPTES